MKLLLTRRADWMQKDLEEMTPLHLTTRHKSPKCLALLLKFMAPGEVDTQDKNKVINSQGQRQRKGNAPFYDEKLQERCALLPSLWKGDSTRPDIPASPSLPLTCQPPHGRQCHLLWRVRKLNLKRIRVCPRSKWLNWNSNPGLFNCKRVSNICQKLMTAAVGIWTQPGCLPMQ